MKLLTQFLLFIFAISTIFLFDACKKDNNSNPEDTIELPDLKAEMMTLSAIAYTAESHSIDLIKDSILFHLADSSLATGAKWELVWGPGVSSNNENLSYVVKNSSGSNPQFAVVIRGTNSTSLVDILEDVDVFVLSEFPYGLPGDSVCRGSMNGFNYLLNAKDMVEGTTLEVFLESVTTTTRTPVYVTGHSQGGGLCPLMAYWLTTHDSFKEKFLCSTFGFASPGWVNKSFRDNFLAAMPADATYNSYVNTLDLVPYGYSMLPQIIERNIPVHVPFAYRILISAFDSILTAKGIRYYNVVIADSIGNIPITASAPGGLTPADTISWYNHWLGVEHNRNNYLKLLDAEPVN